LEKIRNIMEKIKFDILQKIYSFDETLEAEQESRKKNGSNMATFGIQYFDDAMSGIAMNDVVLIGAKSGVGKTAAAINIAYKNAMLGKRVLYFALEAEEHEVLRRIKYQLVSHYFFNNRKEFPANAKIRYNDWYYNFLDFDLKRAEEFANDNLLTISKNMKAIYRTQSKFMIQDFERNFYTEQDNFDLFILDHVHYFDSDEPNENKAMKEVMKGIRDCALIGSKPVVLVAHVRKSDSKNKTIIPELEDFHGSSDLGRIATKAIAIAPAYDLRPMGTKYGTYIKILKCRVGSDVERYTALTHFDISTNQYTKSYDVGRISENKFLSLDGCDLPSWAKKPIKNEFGEYV
jgi:archaellum biogenesis ATPase FlaH